MKKQQNHVVIVYSPTTSLAPQSPAISLVSSIWRSTFKKNEEEHSLTTNHTVLYIFWNCRLLLTVPLLIYIFGPLPAFNILMNTHNVSKVCEAAMAHPEWVYATGGAVPGDRHGQHCAPQPGVDPVLEDVLVGVVVGERDTEEENPKSEIQTFTLRIPPRLSARKVSYYSTLAIKIVCMNWNQIVIFEYWLT